MNCQPRDLPVRALQQALLNDLQAPAAIVPLFNLLPNNPDWFIRQLYYLDNFNDYPASANCHDTSYFQYSHGNNSIVYLRDSHFFQGIFQRICQQDYRLKITAPAIHEGYIYKLVTLNPEMNLALKSFTDKEIIDIFGRINHAGCWLLVEHIPNKMCNIT